MERTKRDARARDSFFAVFDCDFHRGEIDYENRKVDVFLASGEGK
jgi:hypothetical protein